MVDDIAKIAAEPRRVYPDHMKPPYTALQTKLAETLGRGHERS